MKPVLLPLAQHFGRVAIRRRGVVSRTVRTAHGHVHVYDAKGSGPLPTIVMLHGIGSGATAFGRVLLGLRAHACRVVAPDYPGHGFSELEGRLTPQSLEAALYEVLDALNVGPAIFVGNSMGGALALGHARARPENTSGLVLVSPAGAHSSPAEWRELRATFGMSSRADAVAFLDRLYHRTPRLMSVLAHEFPALMSRPAVQDLLAAAKNEDLPSPSDLAALTMPVLLLWGKSERLLPASHLAHFRRHLPPHARIEEPEGYGHCPQYEDPIGLTQRIVHFCQEIAH